MLFRSYLRPRHGADFGPQICMSSDLKDYAAYHAITLMGYSILLQGAYIRSDREIPTQYAGPDSADRLETLLAIAKEVDHSPAQVIIAWMRQDNPPILPIIAGSKVEQLKENIAALNLTLTNDQTQRLNSAGNPVIEKAWIQPT